MSQPPCPGCSTQPCIRATAATRGGPCHFLTLQVEKRSLPEGPTACKYLVLGCELGTSLSRACVLPHGTGQRTQNCFPAIPGETVCEGGVGPVSAAQTRGLFCVFSSFSLPTPPVVSVLALMLSWVFPVTSPCFSFLVCKMKGRPVFPRQMKGTGKADSLGKRVCADTLPCTFPGL